MNKALSAMENQPTLNIGLIGHVAHGKSTLVETLSGVKTGKFKKELEANMTINLGYANLKVFRCTNPQCPPPWCYTSSNAATTTCTRPGCGSHTKLVRHVSFVDAPGHSALMSTMLSGASVMDGALLVVAADQICPCPQTQEHLAVADLIGIANNAIVVQNKVDLCTPSRVIDSMIEIKRFLANSSAEGAQIVPASAVMGLNLDILCQYIVERIPVPVRDTKAVFRLRVIRSFDVNKPGCPLTHLRGGVVGGSIIQGVLRKGQQVEIRPGLIRADKSHSPIITTVESIFSEKVPLEMAVPGGLVAVGFSLDPTISKSNRLVGQVVGEPGTLPPVTLKMDITFRLLRTTTTSDNDSSSSSSKHRPSRLKVKEVILVSVGSSQVVATVTKVKGKRRISVVLQTPICTESGAQAMLFRSRERQWRMIAAGNITSLEEEKEKEIETTTATTEEHGHHVIQSEGSNGGKGDDVSVSQEGDGIGEHHHDHHPTEDEDGHDLPLLATWPVELSLAQCRMEYAEEEKGGEEACDKTPMRLEKRPAVGQVVMVETTRVDPTIGAFCKLLQYNNQEALIVSKEISNKRIRSLRQEVRAGRKEVCVVLRVDEAGFIDLSRKRASTQDRKDCKTEYGAELVIQGVLRRLSVTLQIPLRHLYTHIAWPLQQTNAAEAMATLPFAVGESKTIHGRNSEATLRAFQLALHEEELALGALKLPLVIRREMMAVLNRRLRRGKVKVSAYISLSCLGPGGIETVKSILLRAAGKTVDKKLTLNSTESTASSSSALKITVSVHSPPVYVLSVSTQHKSEAVDAIENLCSRIRQWSEEAGAGMNVVQPPSIAGQ